MSDNTFTSFRAFDAALAAAVGSKVIHCEDDVDRALADVGERLDALMFTLGSLPESLVVSQFARCERRLAAERLLAVAGRIGSSGEASVDRRRARNELSNGASSTRSINRDAWRAVALAANTRLAERAATGDVAVESIDALLKAADGTSGDVPDDLIDIVARLSPDQAASTVDRYLEDNANVGDVENKHQEQHNARRVFRYRAHEGAGRPTLSGIGIEGTDAEVARIWSQVEAAADARYQSDGGRDRPGSQHDSLEHRRFDALAEMFSGGLVGIGGAARSSVVVTVDAAELFEDPDGELVANQLGVGPIPKAVLDGYLSSASLSVLVTGLRGAPLWLGRARRHSSQAQFLSLAIRDRGCVLCRADIGRCVAHHLMPWSAPGRGRTDVDDMALLCQRCHRDLHHRNHTLYRAGTADGRYIWATRPATPAETPAPAPQHRQRE